ncbi:MAG: cytochrome c [Cyanobacteria bacterium J06649_4]
MTEIAPNKAVQNQPAKTQADDSSPKRSVQRVIAMVVGLVLLLCLSLWGLYSLRPSDPYVQSVLQLAGNVERGKDIFTLNCATCHGLNAYGEVGPDLRNVSERKSSVALINQVISGQTPPMPQFQPSERDMADLLAFLKTL